MQNPQDRHRISTTVRDRLLRAWEDSMEMAKEFESYADEYSGEPQYRDVFKKYAIEEAEHAAALKDLLHANQHEQGNQA